jgi:hypothetical protein
VSDIFQIAPETERWLGFQRLLLVAVLGRHGVQVGGENGDEFVRDVAASFTA